MDVKELEMGKEGEDGHMGKWNENATGEDSILTVLYCVHSGIFQPFLNFGLCLFWGQYLRWHRIFLSK
jgi:hypothetical protein